MDSTQRWLLPLCDRFFSHRVTPFLIEGEGAAALGIAAPGLPQRGLSGDQDVLVGYAQKQVVTGFSSVIPLTTGRLFVPPSQKKCYASIVKGR